MRISRTLLSVLLVLSVIGGLSLYRFYFLKTPASVKVDLHPQGRSKGEASAVVKIVEYTDFECPACATANGLMDELFTRFPGKIFLEHKHFPLPRHTHARRASVYAECAAEQGKFWPMKDVLFKSQKSWDKMTTVDTYFSELAVSLGLDGTRLAACVNSVAAIGKVNRDLAEGKTLTVNSTPTFFVNGQRVIGGPLMVQEVEKILGKK
ncbi:MAG: thioredoxin domain-containing protein [Candidatus Omnitrophica bacterium]|nr:thioredoxin domain-containing protein [Candidatus Omnitrophota bacterium]